MLLEIECKVLCEQIQTIVDPPTHTVRRCGRSGTFQGRLVGLVMLKLHCAGEGEGSVIRSKG